MVSQMSNHIIGIKGVMVPKNGPAIRLESQRRNSSMLSQEPQMICLIMFMLGTFLAHITA